MLFKSHFVNNVFKNLMDSNVSCYTPFLSQVQHAFIAVFAKISKPLWTSTGVKSFGIAWEKTLQNVILHCTHCLTQHYILICFNIESSDIFNFWHEFVNDRPLPQSSEWMQVWPCTGNLAARSESKYRYLWAMVNLSLIFKTTQSRASIFHHKVEQKWKSAWTERKILQHFSEF